MKKVMHVALREFLSTVATKGFIIGVLIAPILIAVSFIGISTLMTDKPPKIDGELALIDPTGLLANDIEEYLQPEDVEWSRDDMPEPGPPVPMNEEDCPF